MDAQPELAFPARALNENGLEAILIGNMAAALHGAPVSTIDIDLFFRKTPGNMQKLKLVAPCAGSGHPASLLSCVGTLPAATRTRRTADRFNVAHRWRTVLRRSPRHSGLVRNKRSAAARRESGRHHPESSGPPAGGTNLAVIDILERTRDEAAAAKKSATRALQRSAALKRESDRALIESIRYRLSLAPEKRLNCLRRKIGLRATSL